MAINWLIYAVVGIMAICIIVYLIDTIVLRTRVNKWQFPQGHELFLKMQKHETLAKHLGSVIRGSCYLGTALLFFQLLEVV